MVSIENFIIEKKQDRPILADLYLSEGRRPVIIYVHGYKGFKDWGHLPLIPDPITTQGFHFLKFNFSHGGTSREKPTEFVDLEAFGNNNFSRELDDLQCVINWLCHSENEHSEVIDQEHIYLLGHSRGGAVSILTAARDKRVKKLVTWSTVSDLGRRFPNANILKKWKETGVWYVQNTRTKQNMPHYYQYYEDFIKNRQEYNVIEAERALTIPHLIIHGTLDETVYLGEALHLMSSNEMASIIKLHGATHTFGGYHPYLGDVLPSHLKKALNYTLTFFISADQPKA